MAVAMAAFNVVWFLGGWLFANIFFFGAIIHFLNSVRSGLDIFFLLIDCFILYEPDEPRSAALRSGDQACLLCGRADFSS